MLQEKYKPKKVLKLKPDTRGILGRAERLISLVENCQQAKRFRYKLTKLPQNK